MKMINRKKLSRGQTALEYLLLLALVATVVFVGFKTFVPQTREATEGYYNQVSRVILGGGAFNTVTGRNENDPEPVPGGWCPAYCPDEDACGPAVISLTCACPAPAFGGAYCSGSPNKVCPRNTTKCTRSCTNEMLALCRSKDIACRCSAAPYTCGAPTLGVDACNESCTNPRDGIAIPCGSCSGTEPAGQDCLDTRVSAPAGQAWKVVAGQDACAGEKCTKFCDQDKMPSLDGKACVDFYCQPPIPNSAVLCSGREPNSPAVPAKLVSSCTVGGNPSCDPVILAQTGTCVVSGVGGSEGGECEYACDNFFHFESGASATCAANTCTGILPAGAVKCVENRTGLVVGFPPVDDMFVPGSSNMPWSNVGTPLACSPAKCEYYICPVGRTSIPHVNGCSSSGGVSS